MSFMRVNYRHAGQRCQLPFTPASPASTLPMATLALPVLRKGSKGKIFERWPIFPGPTYSLFSMSTRSQSGYLVLPL